MLVKKMLLPTIKKRKALSFLMFLVIFISSLLTSSFSTAYASFKNNTNKYINEYGYPNITLVTDNEFDSDLSSLKSLDGVDKLERRSTLYLGVVPVKYPKILKLTTFEENSFTKFCVLNETAKSSDNKLNIYVDFSFASKNSIYTGKELKLYNSASETDCVESCVQKIVGSPETIFPMVQYGFQADKFNFGYIFVKEKDLKSIERYKDVKYNEIIIKTKDNVDEKTLSEKIIIELKNKYSINVKTTILKSESLTLEYINTMLNYFYTASVVVPVVFAGIALLLIFLFLYQICKSMTSEIGVLNALGVSKKSISLLLISYGAVIALIGGVLGVGGGFGLSFFIYNLCRYSYSMPLGNPTFNVSLLFISLGVVLIISLLASILSILSIRKLSPKEAMLNNMDKYKPLPKALNKISKNNFCTNAALNSMHKSKVRFFISFFAIIASFATSYGAIAYERSITYRNNELSERIKYDAQIYAMDASKSQDVKNVLIDQKNKNNISAIEDFYAGELNFTFNGIKVKTNICAIENNSSLVYIPDDLKPSDGIILESTFAKKANVNKGDYIDVETSSGYKKIKVSNISNICSDKYNYISLENYKKIFGNDYGHLSFLIKFKDRAKLALALLDVDALPLYSYELINTHTEGSRLTIITARVCVGVALSISFITICIMSQASLLEQKRKFSTLRVLGFQKKDILKILFKENLIYFLLALIPGLLLGVGLNAMLISLSNTELITLLFINPWWVFLVSIGLVVFSLLINLIIERNLINNWNIVENTKNRE